MRDTIAMGLAMADAGTVTESLGLVPSAPNLRPADILMRASTVDGFLACDVGIASPEASGAGLDCVESMRVRKLEHYGEHVLAELEEQNVRYTPLILSCCGRRSSVLTSLLRAAAQPLGHVMGLRLSLWCGGGSKRWLLKSGDVRPRWCDDACRGPERWVRTQLGELCWARLTRRWTRSCAARGVRSLVT